MLLECSGVQSALTAGMSGDSPSRSSRAGRDGRRRRAVSTCPSSRAREITLTGTFRYANTYPLALRLIAAGLVKVDEVITHRFAIDQTEAALTIGRRDPNALKAIVLPQETE